MADWMTFDSDLVDIENGEFLSFDHPYGKEFNDKAKTAIMKLRRAFKSGDPEVKNMINTYEQDQRTEASQMFSRKEDIEKFHPFSENEINPKLTWDLFYSIRNQMVNNALENEDMGESKREFLEQRSNFDMKGRPDFKLTPSIVQRLGL